MKDKNSLVHTTWNCKYHIVFALKYRRQIIYVKYKSSIRKITRELCERKGWIGYRSGIFFLYYSLMQKQSSSDRTD